MRLLVHLGQRTPTDPVGIRELAAELDESPSYLAKVAQELAKAGILRSLRGPRGGVVLRRPPREVNLLMVVNACQGAVMGSFCDEDVPDTQVCAFHQAAVELHQAIHKVLARWTLADLLNKPCPPSAALRSRCVLTAGPVAAWGYRPAKDTRRKTSVRRNQRGRE
ncbi:hypothetical protein JCM19992_19200 [Thermostilla marina]